MLGADGTRALVVPRLEVEHAEAKSTLDRVEHYLEYPGEPRAEKVLERTLYKMALTGAIAHRLLQRYTEIGATETEVSQRASDEATFAMLDAIGEIYRAQSFVASGAHAGYRGQIGRNSAIPHALAAMSSSRRETCSLRARARPCGATSPSSSGRW